MEDNIYQGKDGRLRVYVRKTQKTISYPKYLMEKELGRELLPNEVVHHKDENPLNNELSNLEIKTRSEHSRDHMTKFVDTTAICGWCGKSFIWTAKHQENFYSNRRNHGQKSEKPFCSRECSGRYGRDLQMHSDVDKTNWCSPRRKLTAAQIRYIRNCYVPYDKKYGTRALARQFGVDKSVIDLIVNWRTYKELL